MDHILSPVDGSEPSYRALEVAAELAKRLGAKHTVLAVRQYVVGRKTLAEVWSDSDVKDIFKKAKAIAAASGSAEAGIAECRARDVAHSIVDYAEQNGVGLIVMGASGAGALKAFVIGSVSADVLRKSICPVTIVH
jgi:nucleotide-binding universal stress UspA family protein